MTNLPNDRDRCVNQIGSDWIKKKNQKKNHENKTQRTVKRPGDVQVGSFRAEKMLNDDSSDNFEQLAISDLKFFRGSIQQS